MNQQQGESTDFFIYNASLASLATGVQSQCQVQIEADSAFEWVKGSWSSNTHGTTTASQTNNILCQIKDSGTTLELFSDLTPAPLVFGSGALPLVLPIPRIFMANATITVTVKNYDAALQYDNIFFNFIGRKLYGYRG